MDKIVTDKSILVGDEKLIKKNKWIPLSDMNTDIKILTHKMFDNAFNKIVREHTPKHNVAFISLCTSTRPYQLGRKWKKFVEEFEDKADLIVISSGGVIPQEYWNSYPYLNYDGKFPSKEINVLYNKKMEKRLNKFFKTHRYDYIIANFRPNLRNTPTIKKIMEQFKNGNIINDYIVIPDKESYSKLQERGFPGGKMYPDLDIEIFNELCEAVDNFHLHSNLKS